MHIRRWNNEQSETRRMWKKYKIHAEQSEAGKFFEKIKNKGPKIHYFALKFTVGPPNCITGASKSWCDTCNNTFTQSSNITVNLIIYMMWDLSQYIHSKLQYHSELDNLYDVTLVTKHSIKAPISQCTHFCRHSVRMWFNKIHELLESNLSRLFSHFFPPNGKPILGQKFQKHGRKDAFILFYFILFIFLFLEDISPFLRPLIPLFVVMSALGFKARVDSLRAFSLVWSSDSPLVRHLLTVLRHFVMESDE